MQSWGYKFEQCMMSDTVNGQPGVQSNAEPLHKSALRISLFLDPIPPVIESEEFCCMFRTRLGAHSIVYGAEMDGLEVNDRLNGLTGDVDGIDLNGETFVELKTSRIVEHPGQVGWTRNFSEKLFHHHQNTVFPGENTEEVQADQVVVPVFPRRSTDDCLRIQGRRWDRRKSGTGRSNDD